MNRPSRLLTLVAGATLALGAFQAVPAATAAPVGPQGEKTPGITVPPPHPCQIHPWTPECMPDLDITADPCIQYPEDECPFDDGGDDETTTTTQPEEPTEPTTPDADDDGPATAEPASAVNASPTFTG